MKDSFDNVHMDDVSSFLKETTYSDVNISSIESYVNINLATIWDSTDRLSLI